MLRLKVPAQDDELDQDQQKAERDRELSQGKRKIQTEHIGDGRDRRGSQICFCDKAYPERVDK